MSRRVIAASVFCVAAATAAGYVKILPIAQEWQNNGRIAGLRPSEYLPIPIDSSDIQWRDLRRAFPSLAALAFVHIAAGRLVNSADWLGGRPEQRKLIVNLAFGLGLASYLHGTGTFFLLLCTGTSFLIVRAGLLKRTTPLLRRGVLLVQWAVCLGLLFSFTLKTISFETIIGRSFRGWDKIGGVYRWQAAYNLCILRILSFTSDAFWAANESEESIKEEAVVPTNEEIMTYREQQATPLPREAYSAISYFAYVLYPPLYLSGPTTSFNVWRRNVSRRQTAVQGMGLWRYGLRWGGNFILMEFHSHFYYLMALMSLPSNRPLWTELSVASFAWCTMLTLFWIFHKFLLLWRFFRLWALIDGIEPPENMSTCVFNHYSAIGFWRNWHCSFNQWLVRYLYVPLGGNRRRIFNTFVVFTFVAFWHDIEMKLFAWAWLIALFIVPELLARQEFGKSRHEALRNSWWWRYACLAAAIVNVATMIVANLIGFSFGTKGASSLVQKFMAPREILGGIFVLLVGAASINSMFALRVYRGEAL